MDVLSHAAATLVEGHPFAAAHETAARQPDHVAVDDGVRRLTYAQVVNAAMDLAPRIAAAVPEDGIVCLLVPIDARFPVAMLACLLAGRAFGPVDPAYPAAYVGATLQVGRPDLVITAPGMALEARYRRLDLPAPDPDMIARVLAPMPALGAARPDRLGLLTFTSGSTGLPKAVALPTRTFLRLALWQRDFVGLGPADRILPLQSFSTSVGLTDGYSALVCGATLCIADLRSGGLGVAERALRAGGITIVSMVPSVLRALMKLPDAGGIFATARLIRLSGEPVLDVDVVAARAVLPPTGQFVITMGASECAGILARVVPREETLVPGPVPIGLPYPDLHVTLEDEAGHPVQVGEEGLLTIRGLSVAFGYLTETSIDASQFPPDPDRPGMRILRTGDLFRARPDGVLSIIGRADRQVKINGVRVEPGQTESVLRARPGVDDAAVLARQMPAGPVLVGYAAPAAGAQLDAIALRAAIAAALPPAQRPSRLHVLPAIPRLAGGKIDQAALLAEDDAALAAPRPAPDVLAPDAMLADHSAELRAVLAAWRHVLGHAPGRPDIAFDDDGGDSIGMLQLIFRVERDLHCTLRADSFDVGMNPVSLARAIGAVRRGEAAAAGARHHVILLPGVGGLGPSLARFRAACLPDVTMSTLDYGTWHDWLGNPAFSLAGLLDRLEAEILALQPDGPLRLAGYSLGGLLGFLLARRLRGRGREIGFLGLLDTGSYTAARGGPPQRPWHAEFARLWQPVSRGGGKPGLAVTASRLLTLPPVLPVLRLCARGAPRAASGDFRVMVHHNLNMMVLVQLSTRWRTAMGELGRLEEVPVTLFRCDERAKAIDTEDLGWTPHCADLRVVRVGGDHDSMLRPPHLDGLRAAFVTALDAAAAQPS